MWCVLHLLLFLFAAICYCFSFLDISYKLLCPSLVKDSMTGEQIAKVVLDKMGFDEAVYRLGFNKVAGTIPPIFHEKTNKQKTLTIFHIELTNNFFSFFLLRLPLF